MTPAEGLAFLEAQLARGAMRHGRGCLYRERGRFTEDGTCQRCEAWRALGFDSPRAVTRNERHIRSRREWRTQ